MLQKPIPAYALNPVPIFKVYRPSTGLGAPIVYADFNPAGARWTKVESDSAIKGWTRMYNDAAKFCSHGPNCQKAKTALGCPVGRRIEEKHLLTGSVLAYWSYLQKVVGTREVGTEGKRVSNMKTVRTRVEDKDGKELRLVGVLIGDSQLQRLKALIAGEASSGAGPSGVQPDVKPDIKAKVGGKAPASVAAGSGGGQLPKNTRVIVHGLQGAKHFNDKKGKVQYYDASTVRYMVKLDAKVDTQDELLVKRDNLRLM